MKKNLLMLLVVILIASTTLAAGGGTRITGVISEINTDAKTIVVNGLTIKINDTTTIYITLSPCIEGDFDDLEVGAYVRITGVFHGDLIVAKKIVVH